MNYTLKELLDIPRLRELLDSMDELHSMPSAIIDAEGNALTATGWQDICTKFHRVNAETNRKCIESDRHIEARLDEKTSHVVCRCPMGLVDSATPIIVEGKHLGNVFTGQLFIEPPDETHFIMQSRQYGFDENEYLAAMQNVPIFSEEKLHKNLAFIRNLAQMMAEQGLQHKRQCKAEETLRESEAVFRRLFEDMNDPILLLKDGHFVDCNAATVRLLGYNSVGEFLDRSPSEISPAFQPDGRLSEEKAAEMMATALRSGHHRFEWIHLRADNSFVPVEVTLTPITVGGEVILHTLWRDITERKLAEETLLVLKDTLQDQYEELQVNEESLRDQNDELLATEEMLRVQIDDYETSQKLLKESEAHYRLLTEGVADVVWKVDNNYCITYISPADERLRGYRADEVIGRHIFDLFTDEGIASLKKMALQRQRAEQHGTKTDTETFEAQHRCRNGRLLWAEINSTPERDENGTITGYHGISREITERKEYEKEYLKIEKLESLGVLAGGIAHDFNNILAGVMGNISFAQMFLDANHKSYKPLAEAEKAAVRATELAHQLLTFASGGEPVKKLVSVQNLVKETVSLVLHGSNVKGIVAIPDSIHAIEADEGQMSQVFHNIIINATQAMPGGGTLTVTAQNENLNNTNTMSLPSGGYVRLSFADQGCGISNDYQTKIFDPYFTTKLTGNGLGLASVHSIVSRHGGHISVTSATGKGTSFTIHLPSCGETYSIYQTDAVERSSEDHQGGSILVMDDEKMIRDMTNEMLEYLGYQVTTCENGTEAITQYKAAMESETPFSAVIMDLTIPGGMGGKEAAQLLIAIDPTACLIVSSGYSNDPIMSDYRSYGFAGTVPKPYNIMELGQLLNSVLVRSELSPTT